jgi:hypothetical protein
VAEGARLESVYTPKGYRGFESPFLRSKTKEKGSRTEAQAGVRNQFMKTYKKGKT